MVSGSKIPKTEPSPKRMSTPIEAIITGTDIKKLRTSAFSCLYRSNSILDTVNPDLEMPGNMEIPCTKPDINESFLKTFLDTLSISFFP